MQNKKALSLLIKPASGVCNMRCRYCFYADEMANRTVPSCGAMTEQTAEKLIERAFEAQPSQLTFAFQGGEPTLAGLPFFKRFVQLVQAHNPGGIPVAYALQTNGVLLDDSWAAFFAEEHFLLGLSLDGYPELHDLYRRDAGGEETARRVLAAARFLRKYRVEFNILTVVTAQTVRHVEKLYAFFAREGFAYQQYIPCLDPLGQPRGREEYSLTPEGYGQFLCRLFDLWYEDCRAAKQPYIRYFENLLAMLTGEMPEACGMLGHCSRQLVAEADGRIYPCDFYVLDGYCLGSVWTETFAQMEENRDQLGFIEESRAVPEACAGCRWYPICRSGCRRDRDLADGRLGQNYFCGAYQKFFAHAMPRLEQLATAAEVNRRRGVNV